MQLKKILQVNENDPRLPSQITEAYLALTSALTLTLTFDPFQRANQIRSVPFSGESSDDSDPEEGDYHAVAEEEDGDGGGRQQEVEADLEAADRAASNTASDTRRGGFSSRSFCPFFTLTF